jgi:DEAD/DEAH box helicase domain-containing protein
MIAEGLLASRGRGVCYYPGQNNPHGVLSLRSSSAGHRFKIINHSTGREIGQIEPPNLYLETHPGAIYTHAGETFRVERLDETDHKVWVLPIATNYATSSVAKAEIRLLEDSESRQLKLKGGQLRVGQGRGEVSEQIYGYREEPLFQRGGRQSRSIIKLDHPLTVQVRTELLWLILPPRETFASIAAFDSGLHGLEHLLLGLLPLEVMCDPTDIGSTSFGADILNEAHPTIYFFDSCEGGAGFAHGCYDRIEDLLQLAYRTIKSCRCKAGCPACVQSARCRDANDRVSKEGTRLILQQLLN